MGIKQLYQVISDEAPDAIRNGEIKNHFGRKVAIDASMSIYSFLIAVRSDGQQLMSDTGETTSHLMGMFYRTLRIVENGIKPLYVFDGKPPTLKSGELAKRTARKFEAKEAHEEAKEVGTAEDIEKFSRRTVRVTREHNEECKRLLKLMGIPFMDAPCEAEAQCAELARGGKVISTYLESIEAKKQVYAAASEDMDTLCFESPILLRHLTFSEQRKLPIQEIYLDKALAGLDMSREQFIDLCILLGCDYCDTITKVGPTTALKLIRQYKTIEKVIENLGEKQTVPEYFPYQDARELFMKPDVVPADQCDFKWEAPDTEGLLKFLVEEKGFNEDRVKSGAARLSKNVKTAQQARLEGFFKPIPKSEEEIASLKRKNDEKAVEKKKKAKLDAKAKKDAKKPKGTS